MGLSICACSFNSLSLGSTLAIARRVAADLRLFFPSYPSRGARLPKDFAKRGFRITSIHPHKKQDG